MNPECFRPQEIALDVAVKDSRHALATAAIYVSDANALDAECVFRALWRREQASSTALGDGIAIPHARISGIAAPLTFYLRTRDAIAFDAPDHKPVSHILVILVPADGDPEAHLQLLAWIAAKCSEASFRDGLAAAKSASDVDRVFAGETQARSAVARAGVIAGAN